MKTSRSLCLLIMLLVFVGCDTDKNVDPIDEFYFVKYYGGNGNQSAVDIIATDEGSYFLLGNWEVDRVGHRMFLVNVDDKGKVIWEKKLGTDKEKATDIERTLDGNYVILSENTESGDSDVKLLIVDSNGDELDSTYYVNPENQVPKTVTPLLDGGYIVTGTTAYDTASIINPPTGGPDVSDLFHYRCGPDLVFPQSNWFEQYQSGTFDAGAKVIQQASDVFYVFGATNFQHNDQSLGKINLIYFKLNDVGVAGAPNGLGDPGTDTDCAFVMRVPTALGGGLFVVGTEATSADVVNLHVTKLRTPLNFNSLNDELFDRSLPINSRRLTAVSAAPSVVGQQGYLIVANDTQSDGTTNIWLSKVDHATGSLLWSAAFGSDEEDDTAAAVIELPDGRILMLGTISLINNQSKMVLMKLNSTGQLME